MVVLVRTSEHPSIRCHEPRWCLAGLEALHSRDFRLGFRYWGGAIVPFGAVGSQVQVSGNAPPPMVAAGALAVDRGGARASRGWAFDVRTLATWPTEVHAATTSGGASPYGCANDAGGGSFAASRSGCDDAAAADDRPVALTAGFEFYPSRVVEKIRVARVGCWASCVNPRESKGCAD